ncbi:MAG: hypothetical protein ACOX66_00145 [Oscillospiraceae bacterium]
MAEKTECPCPRMHCPRHGNCEACKSHHSGKKPPYCQRGSAKTAKKSPADAPGRDPRVSAAGEHSPSPEK